MKKKYIVTCTVLQYVNDTIGRITDNGILAVSNNNTFQFTDSYPYCGLYGLLHYEEEVSIAPYVQLEVLDEDNNHYVLLYDHRIACDTEDMPQLYELISRVDL